MSTIDSKRRDVRQCPVCCGDMVRETRLRTIRYKNHSAEIDQPAWWCRGCGEGILDSKDSVVADHAFAKLKANAARGDHQGV